MGLQVHDAASEKNMTIPSNEYVRIHTQALNNDVDTRTKGVIVPPTDNFITMGGFESPSSSVGFSSGDGFSPAGSITSGSVEGYDISYIYSKGGSPDMVFVGFVDATPWSSITLEINGLVEILPFSTANYQLNSPAMSALFIDGETYPITITPN